MGSYAGMLVLPLLQIAAIIVMIKRLRGSKSLLFGVIAVGCWLLAGVVTMFGYTSTSADHVTTAMVVSLLSFGGWIAFLAMLMTIPVGAETRRESSQSPAADTPGSPQTEAVSAGPDWVVRLGKIGALAGFVVYLIVAGVETLAGGDVLSGIGWGFVSGAVGGGIGAAVGLAVEKLR
ncbi:MAG: hypothetical protein RBT76_10840 [candidate division Zixibacteria bacterium]|jgi:hypothetical protein|nr:hypothetical protein [candidate division Zixibacteria bacterium]